MTTTVTVSRAEALRPRSYAMFADLVDVPAVVDIRQGSDGAWTLTFAGDLSAELEATVRLRLTTASDADAAAKAALAAAVAAAAAYVPPILPNPATTDDLAAANADLSAQLTTVTNTLATAVDYLLGNNNQEAP